MTGSTIPYRIRRSPRARRIRVSVHAAGDVEVVLPQRAKEREAERAVEQLRDWIEARQRVLSLRREEVARTQGTLPHLGETLRLVPEPGRTRAHRRGDVLLVPAGPDRHEAIERWYRRAARGEVARRLDEACAVAGLRYSTLTIRGQRSRWASCSAKGGMSFNWRLLLAPPEVLDYVVWHEVCHLQVMDHSPRFWALVERYCPDYRGPQAWLRTYGSTLHL